MHLTKQEILAAELSSRWPASKLSFGTPDCRIRVAIDLSRGSKQRVTEAGEEEAARNLIEFIDGDHNWILAVEWTFLRPLKASVERKASQGRQIV